MKRFTLIFFIIASFSINGQKHLDLIQEFILNQSEENTWNRRDVSNLVITDDSFSKRSGVSHIYANQSHKGIKVINSGGNFAVKNNEVIYSNLQVISALESKVNTIQFSINAKQAINYALTEIGISIKEDLPLITRVHKNKFIYGKGNVSIENIPVELVICQTKDSISPLHLAWKLSIYEKSQKHWWSMNIDAVNGTVISMNDWVVECNFENHRHKEHGHGKSSFSPFESQMEVPPANDAYHVFALPLESPSHGNRSIVTGPSNATASPFGWHDEDGNSGPEYTITRGNNVHAYEDEAANNGIGYSPDGGASLNFDFPLDLNNAPGNNLDPAITNLFYMNNIMHDVWYQYGFDEISGNFQQNNYGNGGDEEDYVLAEAQDGEGINNANFATPEDGQNPRMQMYLWSAPTVDNNLLQINSPSGLSGPYDAVQGGFGPAVPTSPLTADFALVDDGDGDAQDGCEALINAPDLNGKIVVVRRGTCTFVSKVSAAEDAGALAVIVVNNIAGAPFAMGGNDPGIGIPSIMVSQADGESFITTLLAPTSVNGTLQSSGSLVQLDGDFDNGIIAHEYGHGISTRLTGGASNSNCLNNSEQMGEGWSDWFGLMLTIEPGDQGTDVRGIGTYAIGEPTTGNGIRPAPYSTDLNVNNYTYEATNNTGAISEPHGVGFVWCTMIWDMTWALIDSYGYDADLYNGTGGNNMAMALIIEALKLQPCSPGFVDGRDAILQADQLLYGGANQCLIWQVFAARGLGFSANQGSTNSRTDQTEAFDLPAACQAPTVPPVASFTFNSNCSGEVIFSDESSNNPNTWNWDFGDGNTSSIENPTHTYLSSGTYTVVLTSANDIGSGSNSTTVTITLPDNPSVSDLNLCENESGIFTGSASGNINWYDQTGTLLETGNTYTTPPLNSTTTYSVQNVVSSPSQYVGPIDGSIGNGGYHGNGNVFTLNFDASSAFSIVSVWVDADGPGDRTINLYDAPNGGGMVIDQTTINIQTSGPQRITLNFEIPGQGSYSMGAASMNLFRNNNGVNYPYTLNDVVEIVSSSAGANYYYYYYDWEIATPPCLSPITTVVANVGQNTSGTDTQISCDSYTWIDGNTYTSNNNTATFVTQNNNGCDSTVTLDLTIYNSSNSLDVQSACDNYTWIDGNTYTSNNNTATFVTQNSNGCDSIVTLDLTIYNSSNSMDIQSACDSYTWIDGNTYTSNNNTATFVTQTINGCDSIVSLDLTINEVNTNVIQISDGSAQAETANANYQWLDCDDNYNPLLGETGQVFQCPAPCYYHIAVLVTQNNCSDTSDCIILNVLELETINNEIISIYPNPSRDRIFFKNLDQLKGIHTMELLDNNGRVVSVKHDNFHSMQIDTLSDGLYFISITHSSGVETLRLIKQ